MKTEPADVLDLTESAPDGMPMVDPAVRRWTPRRIAGWATIGLAVLVAGFFVFEFLLSGLVQERAQRLLVTELRSLTDEGPATTLGWLPDPGQPVGLLTVPRLNLETVVVEGTSASETARGPGHYRGSPLPGRPGNSVVMGRRATFSSAFGGLEQLTAGDTIQVSTGVGMFTYEVDGKEIVEPGELDILGPTEDNRLTLATSSPEYGARARLVVTAMLEGAPARQKLRPQVLIPPNETGLAGEPGALGPLLLWLEVLLLAGFGAVWISRRISTRVAWLLAAPVALASFWAMSLAANRLLPATL